MWVFRRAFSWGQHCDTIDNITLTSLSPLAWEMQDWSDFMVAIWGWMVLGIGFLIVTVTVYGWWSYQRFARRMPKPPHQAAPFQPQPETWPNDRITVTWIGHSTMYINFYGVRLLTDPVFSEKVGVSVLRLWRVGSPRYTAPALTPTQLVGEVDILLLSHAHLDHLDLPSLRKLMGDKVQVVTAKGTSWVLRKLHFGSVAELSTGQSLVTREGVKVTALPVRHWGARYPWNRRYGWNGYILEYRGHRLLFAGDTALTDSFRDLENSSEVPLELAMMPIGAYSPDVFQVNHCTPEQAWSMFLDSGARWLAPMHWHTFVLSKEPVTEPLQRLLAAAGPQQDRVVLRWQGQVFTVPVALNEGEVSGEVMAEASIQREHGQVRS
ncbi:MBL fold metallo-hydrolase [Alicyclobacillaceae bacterium I2511]|nr:MBL fold metallo-hydrolase [Alicyclobacillaceae bacterium I2511]